MKYIDTFLWIYLLWNIVVFIIVGADKLKAKKRKFRISELFLLMSSFLMGGVGMICGMISFHHKVSKLRFRILVPIFVIINMGVLYYIVRYYG